MPNLRDIRQHMTAVDSLRHMTNALKRVSAARTKKYRNQLKRLEPYTRGLERAMSLLTLRHGLRHRLLHSRPILRDVVILIGGDQGLCGSYNHDIVHGFARIDLPPPMLSREIVVFGLRLADMLEDGNIAIDRAFPLPRTVTVEAVKGFADELADGYLQDRYQRVIIVRAHGLEGGGRTVESQILLPSHPPDTGEYAHLSPEIEPDSILFFDHLVPRFFLSELRVAFLEAMIIEEEARAMAMQAATTNADELKDTLGMQYRRVRQERITRELLELVAAGTGRGS